MKKDISWTINALEQKKISSAELVREALMVANKNKHNAYITVTEDLALKTAKESDMRRSNKKLFSAIDGLPYSLKDLFLTEGVRTTGGSAYLKNYIPPYDGFVAATLKNAGACLVGKVGCDEFGMGSVNHNTPFGIVLNPTSEGYLAGGSSGGSAASVAEGSALFSMGTDTGGSVRLPANFCGLVGYKPSYGRISRSGQIAYGSSLDQASILSQSVSDLDYLLPLLTGKDPHDASMSTSQALQFASDSSFHFQGKTLGYDPSFIEGCDLAVRDVLKSALTEFQKRGVRLIELNLEHLKYSVAVYYLIATSEASANLARFDGVHYGHRSDLASESIEQLYCQSRSESLGKEVQKRIMLGTFALSSGYADEYFSKAAKVRRLIYEDFIKAFKKCQMIFSPVCTQVAPTLADLETGKLGGLKMYLNDLYTIPVNLAGLPGLAIPYGKASGMSTGFQLIGPSQGDEDVISWGKAWEKGAHS
jgi:aspartyl-tRNA(Asn)/glutamyl-tRNA(Gln) amidotransferase subunit A